MNSPSFIERLEQVLAPWMEPPRKHRPKSIGTATLGAPKRMRAYAEAALEGERRKLAAMPSDSGRNWELFYAGCRLGKFVHHGVLSHDEVGNAIVHDACNANGLIKDDGLRACQASLESGLHKAEGDDLPILEDRPLPGGETQAGPVVANTGAPDSESNNAKEKRGTGARRRRCSLR